MRGVNKRGQKKDQIGQAAIEYILLIFIVLMVFFIAIQLIKKANVIGQIAQPIKDSYAHAYRYGHPLAKGYDDGGPDHHPRAYGGNNFRLYINPE